MATTINAGRVRFVTRGAYNNSTQYYLFDLVDYNGSSYIAKGNTVGNLPTNNQYWQLIAEKGNVGNVGPKGETGNGISKIEKTNTSGLVDTYTITFTDGSESTFTINNGNGIVSIVKTDTTGLVDTYTITFTNGTTTTYQVTNGEDGEVTETEVDRLRTEIKDLQNNRLTNSATGESIDVSDSADSEVVSIESEGNSKQETTIGKNKIGLVDGTYSQNGVTIKVENGVLKVNGTSTATIGVYIPLVESVTLLNGETNTFQYSVLKGTISGSYDYSMRLLITNYATDANSFGGSFIGTTTNLTYTQSADQTFTYVYFYGVSGKTTNAEFGYQLEQGNDATDYEKYTNRSISKSNIRTTNKELWR